jgi:hypothetical protein
MSMFDIEDSKNVRLKANKTSDSKFLRARGVGNLSAVQNEAGLSKSFESPRRLAWFRDNISVAVIASLLVVVILGLIIFFFPLVKGLLP